MCLSVHHHIVVALMSHSVEDQLKDVFADFGGVSAVYECFSGCVGCVADTVQKLGSERKAAVFIILSVKVCYRIKKLFVRFKNYAAHIVSAEAANTDKIPLKYNSGHIFDGNNGVFFVI